jgi:hypothetical protein
MIFRVLAEPLEAGPVDLDFVDLPSWVIFFSVTEIDSLRVPRKVHIVNRAVRVFENRSRFFVRLGRIENIDTATPTLGYALPDRAVERIGSTQQASGKINDRAELFGRLAN